MGTERYSGYREHLANDLIQEPDHQQRAHNLDLEKLSFRYDKAKAAHLKDVSRHIEGLQDKKDKAGEFERAKFSSDSGPKKAYQMDFEQMSRLWFDAREFEKAEQYYAQAGTYREAAQKFMSIGDEERAKKFWTLCAQHPTGYLEEQDFNVAEAWDLAGNIPEAIKAYERALVPLENAGRNISYDLHGDVTVAKGDPGAIKKRIKELKEMSGENK